MVDSFVSFLQAEAGESLSAVGTYDDDGYEIQYLRDDIGPDMAKQWADALHHQLTWEWAPPEDPALDDFGPLLASVNLHQDVVILHFPNPDAAGVVVTFDVDIAKNLHEFAQDCLTYLDRHHD